MRIRKQMTAGFLLLVFLITFHMCANAENGSITVKYAAKNHTVPISGATFSIVQLIEFCDGIPVLCDAANKNHVTVEDIYQRPEEVARKISENMIIKDGKTTGVKGEVCFNRLKEGVYLIAQTGKKESAVHYQIAPPSIVQIPEENLGVIQYDIVTFPKTVNKTDSEESPGTSRTPIQTGDETFVWKWILLMISAALAAAMIFGIGRRDVHNGKSNQ